jgi:hypothetical protein
MNVVDRTLYNRLVDKIRFDLETGCWVWHGYVHRMGYGSTSIRSKAISAHRAMWLAVHGDFKGLDVCHRCDNKRCVSPLHLYLASHQQNLRDASKSKLLQGQWKTHCKRDHPLSGDNLYLQPGTGFRGCKTCTRERARRRWHDDPEFRARQIAREKERRTKLREQRRVSV